MIKFQSVSKVFRTREAKNKVLDSVSISIEEGEFVTLFGPTGCGKSTLLSMASGSEEPDSGRISINGQDPRLAKIGFVFQNYKDSLLPWRTVLGNVLLAYESQRVGSLVALDEAEGLLKKAGLSKYKDKYCYELSGGMKQLVAICRAFAFSPDVLLLDEPFSSLDLATTRTMEMELLDIWQKRNITTLFVSHDIDEAIILADRVVVLSPRPGKVKQVITVDLPRPRKVGMIKTKAFDRVRRQVIEASL